MKKYILKTAVFLILIGFTAACTKKDDCPYVIEEKVVVVPPISVNTVDPFAGITDPTCPTNLMINGSFETITSPLTINDQQIGKASGWAPIWGSGDFADLYQSTFAPVGIPPTPASGNYSSLWITNEAGGAGFREGMFNILHTTILPTSSSKTYSLNFKTANLYEGNSSFDVEIGIYGVYYKSTDPLPAAPLSAVNPLNANLFGATKTVLLGKILLPLGVNNVWVNRTVLFDANMVGFPAQGINHIMITKSDRISGGRNYVAFDDFCLNPV